MRIRTVKPELFTNPLVTAWPAPVRWTFVGLYCYVDDYGRGVNDPRLVRSALYPLDDKMTVKRVLEHLDTIAAGATSPLCRYEADDGSQLLHIVGWFDRGGDFFQQVNRRAKSMRQPCPRHDEHTLFTVSP